MTRYARISNGEAVEVITSEHPLEESFHPDIAGLFSIVTDDVVQGSRVDNKGKWTHPEPIIEAQEEVAPPCVSPVEFKLLFTPKERVDIKAARAADPVIDDFFDIVDDPRLTHVNLALKSTSDALDYLTAKGILAEGRKVEILTGIPQ